MDTEAIAGRYHVSIYRGFLTIDAGREDEVRGEAFQALAEDPSLLVVELMATCERCGNDYVAALQDGHDLYCAPEKVDPDV